MSDKGVISYWLLPPFIGWTARKCSIASEAFQVFAELYGMPLRQIIKGLPKHELNYALPKKR